MNKIIINHDLLTTLDYAQNGFSLKANAKKAALITIPVAFIGSAISHSAMMSMGTISLIEQTCINLCSTSFIYLSNISAYAVVDYLFKNTQKDIAEKKLAFLAKQLNALNINTNSELLKQSKLIKREYHFLKDGAVKGIEEDKYIEIVIKNNIDHEFTETILQQHIIGSNEYEISIQSPQKKLEYKMAKHTI